MRTNTPRLSSCVARCSSIRVRNASRTVLRETFSAAQISGSDKRLPGGNVPSRMRPRTMSATCALPLALGAIASYFAISTGQSGLLTTVTLVVSAAGGALAGMLADRIGRVRTLQLTIAMYAVFTVLCGCAWNFESLLAFRALQGLG